MSTMFFGYPSSPQTTRETIVNGITAIANTGLTSVLSWEDLSGPLVVADIAKAIDSTEVSAFALTDLNPNVMFELGYAIGRKKPAWLLFDESQQKAKQAWDSFNLLTPVRYYGYKNSEDIRASFIVHRPDLVKETVYGKVIEATLRPMISNALFYMKSPHENEAERTLATQVVEAEAAGWRVTTSDPEESTYTISWYARNVYSASSVLIHLTTADVEDAWIHNARAALVGGFSFALGRPVLMLAGEGFERPFDYRELLSTYKTANECGEKAVRWLEEQFKEAEASAPRQQVELATELRSLRLGEDVAENEHLELEDYFLDTASFQQVLDLSSMIFVGRKGAGKTANLFQASRVLREDARNLVVVVKPPSYDVQAVMRLLTMELAGDLSDYMVQALWQYLLETEIALAAVEEARSRPAGLEYDSPEWQLDEYCTDLDNGIDAEFAVRLERMVEKLASLPVNEGVESSREAINQVYSSVLSKLRSKLAPVLRGRRRVAVLVDNLDRAWDKTHQRDELSLLLLGLFSAVGRLEGTYRKAEIPSRLTLAVFLRTDIFDHVRQVAREPDKLNSSEIVWRDENMLTRIVERRYQAAREDVDGSDLWTRFFVPSIDGITPQHFILSKILPRPRDIVHFCNASIVAAANAGKDVIDEDSLHLGWQAYSKFAYDAIQVENGTSIRELRNVFYELMGAGAVMEAGTLSVACERAGIASDDIERVVDRLVDLSVLGLEIAPGEFRFSETPEDASKARALARRHQRDSTSSARFEIHPAFRAFLEVT